MNFNSFVLPVALSLFGFLFTFYSGVPLIWFYPYALLCMGYRNEALQAWLTYAPIDNRILHEVRTVPEIAAKGKQDLRAIYKCK